MFENMSPQAMAAWEILNQKWGKPLSVNSAYRDPAHNTKVGGAKNSQHMHGNAFDVSVAGMEEAERLRLIEQAKAAGFQGVGVYDNALHFDVGPQRAWGADYTSKSLPQWAQPALGYGMPKPEMAGPSEPLSYGDAGAEPDQTMMQRIMAALSDPETNQDIQGVFQQGQQQQQPAWLTKPQAPQIQSVRPDVSPYLQFFQSLRG